jgi:phage shock protein A
MNRPETALERWIRIVRQTFGAHEPVVEDPVEALDILIGNQLAAIAQSRADLLTVASAEKRLQALVDEFGQRRDRYDAAARTALSDGNTDAARTNVRRSIEAERLIAEGRRHLDDVAAQRRELAELIEQMRAEYDRLRMRRESLNALASGARATATGQESMTPLGPDGAQREKSLEDARNTLATLRARASALSELRASGALDPVGAGEFDGANAISDDDVDRRLTALGEGKPS